MERTIYIIHPFKNPVKPFGGILVSSLFSEDLFVKKTSHSPSGHGVPMKSGRARARKNAAPRWGADVCLRTNKSSPLTFSFSPSPKTPYIYQALDELEK
jgi:hypothetical protein